MQCGDDWTRRLQAKHRSQLHQSPPSRSSLWIERMLNCTDATAKQPQESSTRKMSSCRPLSEDIFDFRMGWKNLRRRVEALSSDVLEQHRSDMRPGNLLAGRRRTTWMIRSESVARNDDVAGALLRVAPTVPCSSFSHEIGNELLLFHTLPPTVEERRILSPMTGRVYRATYWR